MPKNIISKIEGRWIHDASSFHSMTPDVSTFTVVLGDPNSIFKSTMSIALPSDVILKSSTNLLMYKGALAGGSELNPTYTPAAAEGDIYSISTDGYINSTKVKAQDMAICIQNTPAATAETKVIVDANWNYIQGNIDEDEYSKVGHVHDVEVNVSTGLGGAVVPQGTITTPAINANTSMGSFSYVESGTCSFTTSSGSLGSALTTYSFDPDDPENLVFGSATLSYEKVDSVSFDATTQSFSAVVGVNPTLASDPVFTGVALTPHTHNVAFEVSTGPDYVPGQLLRNTVKYTTSDNQPMNISPIVTSTNAAYTYNGPTMVSNEYNTLEGCYVMTFDNDIDSIGIDESNQTYGINFCQDSNYVETPDTRLTSVTLPKRLSNIGDKSFSCCSNLTTVDNISRNLDSIGESAFESCSALTSIELPEEMISIDGSAFCNCTSLEEIDIPVGLTTISQATFKNCTNIQNSISIPEGVENIEDQAFYNTAYINDVTIASTVDSIGVEAFCNCSRLQSITSLNTTPPTLGTDALKNVPSNCMIYVPAAAVNAYKASSGWSSRASYIQEIITTFSEILYTTSDNQPLAISVISNEGTNYTYNGPTVVSNVYDSERECCVLTVGGNINYFGIDMNNKTYGINFCQDPDYVATQDFRLTSITLPDSITEIGDKACNWCTNLTNANIGPNIDIIGEGAFSTCSSLTTINLPNEMSEIAAYAFDECSSLSSLTLPTGITSIPYAMLRRCTSLTGALNIPSGVTTIGGQALYGSTGITSITLPNTVTTIEKMAFFECTGLTSINLPNSITTIVDHAFAKCSSLTSVTIPNTLTAIDGYLFYKCTSLSSVSIPNTVTILGDYSFGYCSALSSINIPEAVTSIGDNAFQKCTSLVDIVIPNNVTTIGNNCFAECSKLQTAMISSSATSIGDLCFKNCKALTRITSLNTTPPVLGTNAFQYVPASTPIYVPYESLNAYKTATYWSVRAAYIYPISVPTAYKITYTSSDNQIITPYNASAFGANITSNVYNVSIGTITFDSSILSIGQTAFYEKSNLTSINIPNTITSIGQSAFEECTALTSISYEGTKSQWNALSKGDYWHDNTQVEEIHCADDTINLISKIYYTSTNNQVVYTNYEEQITYEIISNTYDSSNGGIMKIANEGNNYSINDMAFFCCHTLKSIIIPDDVVQLSSEERGYGAFEECTNLQSIVIGKNITNIKEYTFYDCYNLTSITIQNTIPPTLNNACIPSNCVIYVPASAVNTYKTASGWSERAAYIQAIPTVELVDLGLSVKWAKYNVGATCGGTAESWYGNYYAWGETDTKSNYIWSTYEHCYEDEAGDPIMTKYTDANSSTLLSADDAATQNNHYRMPTKTELQELINGTNRSTWITNYNGITGLNGYTFTHKKDSTKFIFIPAAGRYDGSVRLDTGEYGNVWSASLIYEDNFSDNAFLLHFNSDEVGVNYGYFRCDGLPVRGVKPNDED